MVVGYRSKLGFNNIGVQSTTWLNKINKIFLLFYYYVN